MSTLNHITKVAIVGAGGNVGKHITSALLSTKIHTITALTRAESKSTLPEGIHSRIEVDYDNHTNLVDALQGQEALVITISGMSPLQQIEDKLIRAAGEAGVQWIFPNEWSPDSAHEGILRDVFFFGTKVAARKTIQDIGKSSFISVVTGFWYEYSLAIQKNFGFNFAERKVQLYDDGETKICVSTWPQIGRAVASVLNLPINSEYGNDLSLESLKNNIIYINSFTVSQKDILASALRVTGTRESDWAITQETSQKMYDLGMESMKKGDWRGPGNFLYGRIFFPDGCGNFENRKGTYNEQLVLPKEDIDQFTQIAIERQEAGAGWH